jgi:signal transduction histidine kinase
MKLKISTKAMVWLVTVIIIAMATSVTALIYAWQTRYTLDDSIMKDTREMLNATELDIALLKQRDFMAFHLLADDGTKWMDELDNLEPLSRDFQRYFQGNSTVEQEKEMHFALQESFRRYDVLRNRVLALYRSGDQKGARDLAFTDLAKLTNTCITQCDELVQLKKHDILEVLQWSERESKYFSLMVVASIFFIVSLGFGLVWMLAQNIFLPLRKIASEVQSFSSKGNHEAGMETVHQDDLETLVNGLKMFMAEVAETRSDLAQSRHQLLQSTRLAALGNTVAQVAHEIKNRLIVVGGFARSIEKKAGAVDMVQKKAVIIYQEVNKLEHMLKQITEFSKPMQLETEICSLNTLLEELLPKLSAAATQNIKLNTSLAPDLPPVSIDKELMEQVIINLVKNAMEAMGKEGNVYINTSTQDRGITLIIRDEGPGMTKDIQARIFEPFFTTKREGTGLGLAISRKIILDHGGELHCDSFPGKGTVFTITLPSV